MKGTSLGEARRLFRARRFPDVIRLLEPDVFKFRESFDYFWLLGFSCLQAGDLGGAFSYISRAHQLKDDDIGVLLCLAAIHLRRAENEGAIKRWLEVLELQPSNRIARRGLDMLRRGFPPDKLQELIDSGRLKVLYPALERRSPPAALVGAILALLILAAAGYLFLQAREARAPERPGVSGIDIPDTLSRLTEDDQGSLFVFTEREVRQTFQKAKTYLLAYRDNMAAVEINRVLLSNAASSIKERARLLKGFVTQPTFDTLRDSFSYKVVSVQPALYDGCSVRWRGKVANLRTGKQAIAFDLLVGYDQEKELEGIVPVTLPFAADLADGTGLELLGQVVVQSGRLSLVGISLHRLPAQ